MDFLLDWIMQHPHWAGFIVFLIALSESLVVLGLLVPGALLLFGVGALVASGALPLGSTLLWAMAGASLGDGFSFWVGRHYHQRLRVVWPFRRYPRLMARGVDFFHRHGGKSILFGRFVGPVRPIVPAVAGMLDMPVGRYLLVNIIATVLWAPAYILPGMVFGASLGMAAQVAGRLVVLLLILLVLIWFSLWLVHRLVQFSYDPVQRLITRTLNWSRDHPVIRPMAGALLDPDHPETRGLVLLAGFMLLASFAFLFMLQQVLAGTVMGSLDSYLFHSLQTLRNPWADRVMVFITQFGDSLLLVAIASLCWVWLAWQRRWSALLHWLGAFFSISLLTHALKIVTDVPRPLDLYPHSQAFPSSHASLSLAVYGFLAVLIARELAVQRHWIPYAVSTALVTPIALSRLYLGAHWLSDVIAGLALGLFWVSLWGIAYRRHHVPALRAGRLLGVFAIALALVGSAYTLSRFDHSLQRYAVSPAAVSMRVAEWQDQAWRDLPAYRLDLAHTGRHPLDLQWAGELSRVDALLQSRGWLSPAPLDLAGLLKWLAPADQTATTPELPLLPQLHDGYHPAQSWVRPLSSDSTRQLVLRLWPSHIELDGQPLWIGNVAFLDVDHSLWLPRPRTDLDFNRPLDSLLVDLQAGPAQVRIESRDTVGMAPDTQWDGRSLLISLPQAEP